jgi:hypothetical protein
VVGSTLPAVTAFEYDEEASLAEHRDVVHEVPDSQPTPAATWVEAMRRLNGTGDPLARRVLALHRDCGSGTGPCDVDDDHAVGVAGRHGWGCETTEVVADHFGVTFPEPFAS